MRIRMRVLALALVGLVAGGFAVVQPRPVMDPTVHVAELEPVYAPPAEEVAEHVLRPGETLSEVLGRAALGGSDVNGLLLALREHVNPRRLLPHTSVLVRRWVGNGEPRAVEVELNADHVVRLTRQSVGWAGELVETPVVVDTITVAGRLGEGGSVYRAVVEDAGLDLPRREREALVYQLAHIYGWELDFSSDMRAGDAFRVVYEREARPDGTSRASKVLVAEFVTRDRTLPAIFFDPDGDGGDYFNAEGQSLRLQFRRYPVEFARITSRFSWRRYHPILKRNRPHLGTDFGTGFGTPILSTADGVVAFSAYDGGYGNLVKIDHGNGYETRYAHLSRFAKGVKRGARVRQGQVIGYSGDTGLATAPHLHYEFRRHGQPVDPGSVRLPAAPPVPEEHMARFEALSAERSVLLASVPLPADDRLALSD